MLSWEESASMLLVHTAHIAEQVLLMGTRPLPWVRYRDSLHFCLATRQTHRDLESFCWLSVLRRHFILEILQFYKIHML